MNYNFESIGKRYHTGSKKWNAETVEAVGVCIKCQACVRHCPVQAKYFEDVDFLSHVAMLEQNYGRRAENVTIL